MYSTLYNVNCDTRKTILSDVVISVYFYVTCELHPLASTWTFRFLSLFGQIMMVIRMVQMSKALKRVPSRTEFENQLKKRCAGDIFQPKKAFTCASAKPVKFV